jgi:enoyl-[acyl-carrier protein] reductase/trans-2-enoyl-CoA reductase (NAD+)
VAAFDQAARAAGLYTKSINGDAFSDEVKKQVCEAVKRDLGGVDLVVYSVATPRRTHPKTGQILKSVLKPIGSSYTNKSLDFDKNEIEEVTLQPATQEEIEQTIGVMGGEDWEMWMEVLQEAGLLINGIRTVAYSYIGPDLTWDIYRKGTIGQAKDHLERTAQKLDQKLKKKGGRAFISVNKALVTQSSSAIPFIPLYFVILMKIMKEKGIHEDCIQQMYRLFATRLYAGGAVPVDEERRIRMDNWEVREDVQNEVKRVWSNIDHTRLSEISDLKGYEEDFLKLFGFGLPDVDYSADVDPDVKILE